MIAFDDECRVGGQADLEHRVQEGMFPRPGRLDAPRSGDKGNLFVAQSGQMLHCLPDPVQVVDTDVADPGAKRPHIHKHQRYFSQLQILEQHFFHAEGHDRNPLDPALDHSPHRTLHAFRIIARRGQQNLVVMLDGNALKDLHNFREERVGDFRNDEAKNPAASRHQGPGLCIGVVSQFFDYTPDAFGQLRIYRGNPVDGAGCGGGGNLCPFCDFANIHWGSQCRCRF